MPLVQVVPNTTGPAPAPGYTYVPDTGYDPSKIAINPSSSKRAVRISTTATANFLTGTELTARQQDAVRKRIEALARDDSNPNITLPGRKDLSRNKSTTAVKKILLSEKKIQHHLDDEAAALARQAAQGFPSAARSAFSKSDTTSILKRKRDHHIQYSLSPHAGTPDPSGGENTSGTSDIMTAPDTLPKPPSEEEMQELLAAPPLPYAAARAGPPPANSPPPRVFCELCGYWGNIRCLKCGARVCGLECKENHMQAKKCF